MSAVVVIEHAKKLHAEYMHGLQALTEFSSLGMFCSECGETEPEDGFYPMWISNYISGVICNRCEKRIREEAMK